MRKFLFSLEYVLKGLLITVIWAVGYYIGIRDTTSYYKAHPIYKECPPLIYPLRQT
jgi:hypothetical protein